jgi:hypothetical protein
MEVSHEAQEVQVQRRLRIQRAVVRSTGGASASGA